MTPDPLTFAQEALGCRRFASWGPCATHGDAWPCFTADALAALIEARDREIRADECEEIAKAVWAACSGLLDFSTGEVINVDGGFHIRRL